MTPEMVSAAENAILHRVCHAGSLFLVLPLHLLFLGVEKCSGAGQANPLSHKYGNDKNHDEQFERRMGHDARETGHDSAPTPTGSCPSTLVVFPEATEKTWLDPVPLWPRPLTTSRQGNNRKIEEDEMLEGFTYALTLYGVVVAAAWIWVWVSPR
jgi:hypothetical protein